MARKEFVGWTGLAPIAGLIEHIIGIRGDFVQKQITWDINLTETNGIERYPFGPDGLISFKAHARNSVNEKPVIEVESNIEFELLVRYGNQEKTFQVKTGKNKF